jgi:hypothetical protein
MDPNLADALAEYARLTVRVEFFAADDPCPVCAALAGQAFDADDAPIIPVPTCQNEICRCDYLPVVG